MIDNYREHYKQFMKDMIRQSEIDSLKYVHLTRPIINYLLNQIQLLLLPGDVKYHLWMLSR